MGTPCGEKPAEASAEAVGYTYLGLARGVFYGT